MVRFLAALAATALLAACGSNDAVLVGDAGAEVTSAPKPVASELTDDREAAPADGSTSEIDDDELSDPVVLFIALVDEALVGTQWHVDVLDAPEVFVATGELFCDRLDEDVSVDEILESYVTAVGDDSTVEVDDDTFTLAGSILGTAVGTLCTEHRATVEALQ